MAVGATYSTRRHPDVCEDPAEYYALRAKALLEIELDNPTIATAQALLVLSVHEGARTRDTRGNESPSSRFTKGGCFPHVS
jgi:hypothetical protein